MKEKNKGNKNKGNKSLAEKFATLPKSEREKILNKMSPKAVKALRHDWLFWGRPKQHLPNSDWDELWAIAGRGFGKTRMATEAVRKKVEEGVMIIALVGRTPADVRDVLINGESGLMGIFPEDKKPTYKKSEGKVIFHTGAVAHVYSGENPDKLRGPQHEFAVLDEFASYQYPDEVISNLRFGLRLGKNPQMLVTTTPRPIPEIIKIREESKVNKGIILVSGSTYENKSNLPKSFIEAVTRKYAGTKLGRQELYAEILDGLTGTMWDYTTINETSISEDKFNEHKEINPITRTVISIDPAVSTNEESDETGIAVVAVNSDGTGYILEDLTGKYTPSEWGIAAIDAYYKYNADCIVAESNQGGDLVKSNIISLDRFIEVKLVRAIKSKAIRAEPVASLSQQRRLFFVGNDLEELKEEMITWSPIVQTAKSPNRLDAVVWGVHELILNDEAFFDEVKCW